MQLTLAAEQCPPLHISSGFERVVPTSLDPRFMLVSKCTQSPYFRSNGIYVAGMSNWWDDLQSWEERMAGGGDPVGDEEYSPGGIIMKDHNILAGVRNNDFDLNDPTYCEFWFSPRKSIMLWTSNSTC